MTSAAKDNHRRVVELCKQQGWFGRGRGSFRLFEQVSPPLLNMVACSALNAPDTESICLLRSRCMETDRVVGPSISNKRLYGRSFKVADLYYILLDQTGLLPTVGFASQQQLRNQRKEMQRLDGNRFHKPRSYVQPRLPIVVTKHGWWLSQQPPQF